jgi:hypothetical protein
VPTSKIKIIFAFENKEYFTNKYITFLSILFIGSILLISSNNLSKIGEVTNVLEFQSAYQTNEQLLS